MRHARSTQFIPHSAEPDTPSFTLGDLREWERLGGKCTACTREGWIDKYALRHRYGRTNLVLLQPLLRCCRCNHKGDNRFILGMMARD
jgi:hypothetical protein